MEYKELERLASLETDIKGIKESLIRLDEKIDTWQRNYVPRAEINEMFRARDKEIEDVKEEIDKLEQEKSNNKALLPAWAGVIVALISLLITLGRFK